MYDSDDDFETDFAVDPKAFSEGMKAREQGLPITKNPYPKGSSAHYNWNDAWKIMNLERNLEGLGLTNDIPLP